MLLLQRYRTRLFFLYVLFSVFEGATCDYAWPLPKGFPVGSRAIIRGTPPADASYKVFGINFIAYSPFENEGDIDFHIAARYGSGHVAVNNYILGKNWQEEILYKDSPIQGGRPFEIMILSEPTHFSVFINDVHYLDFSYRKPLDRIKYLHIVASVTLSLITVDTITVHSWPLKNGFPPPNTVTIYGTPTKHNFNQEFSVNFQNCAAYGKECYIAFRMLVQYGKNIVSNNSYQKGVGWGQPEVHSNSAITVDQPFVIVIKKEPDHFKIKVNNREFCKFYLRQPHSDIKYLVLKDGVDVITVALS